MRELHHVEVNALATLERVHSTLTPPRSQAPVETTTSLEVCDFIRKGNSVEEQVFALLELTSSDVDNGSIVVFHSINEFELFCVTVELFLGSFDVSTDFDQVELHRSVVVGAFEPAIEETTMDLGQLEHYVGFDVLVDNQLGQGVSIWCMCVAQGYLGVTVLVEANRGLVEELDVLVEGHPEDPVQLVVHRDLT